MLYIEATNLPLVMHCNGSRDMPAAYPTRDLDPTARDEGNAAHWIAEKWCKGTVPVVGMRAPNGYMITDDMIEHVAQYVSALDIGEIEVTTTFGTDRWQVNARADHIKYLPDQPGPDIPPGILIVDDFKYGFRLVEAENNWTLIAHAIGYCLKHNITPQTIVLRIHQPRPHHPDGPLREWKLTYEQLRELYAQIDATLSNPANTLQAGPWCRNCSALANCPAAQASLMNSLEASSRVFVDTLSDDELNYELGLCMTAKATIEASYDALKELATHRISQGHALADFGLEPQFANTRWKPGITPQVLTMASGFDCSKPGAITPAEYRRRGGSEQAYKALTERPMTGNKLVRMSADKRARRAGLGDK